MPDQNYSDPVARLLNAGDPRSRLEWLDYPQVYGLTLQDVPELIRMACDELSFELDADEDVSVYRNVHAWRALGQLRAAEAAEPLTGLLRWVDEEDDDWVNDDLPCVLAMIGPTSLAPLGTFLADAQRGVFGRVAAIEGLRLLAEEYPGSRAECLAAISSTLQHFAENDPDLNAFLIDALADLKVVEAAPLVEQAFKSDRVELSIRGDWEDFQVDVGLLPERLTEPEYGLWLDEPEPIEKNLLRAAHPEDKKAKAKRKQEKKSRKQNRKKKKK